MRRGRRLVCGQEWLSGHSWASTASVKQDDEGIHSGRQAATRTHPSTRAPANCLATCYTFIHSTLCFTMATLNTSTNGPSIKSSYQSVVNSPPPSGPAASSPTYGQWALFSVSAPLVNAFQQDSGGKESILKVQSTGGSWPLAIPPELN